MEVNELLSKVVTIWERQIKMASERKEEQFGKTARELWSFKGKTYRDLYLTDEESARFSDQRSPYYKARINKTAEAISIFVPYCLSQLPERIVSPDRPPLPLEIAQLIPGALQSRAMIDQNDTLTAYLLQWFLNYTPREYGQRREVRTALGEAFGKGSGIVWHEMVEAPGGLIPASYYDSIDYYFIDPDTLQTRDGAYIIRERHQAAWKLAELTGLPREMFKGRSRSAAQAAIDQSSPRPEFKNDIVTYYEVYSRAGIGHWLDSDNEELKPLAGALDALGPYVYLQILPGEPYPLNVRPAMLTGPDAAEELRLRLQWPIKFYAETAGNPWPCTRIDLLPNSENPWATSPLEAGLAIQIFLDHFYTFLINRIRISTGSVILASKALGDDTIEALRNVKDLLVKAVDGKPGEDLEKLLAIFNFPELNKDAWAVMPIAERQYENATGLTAILYGNQGPTQIRTAKESMIREAHATTRPQDYADTTEDWLAAIAAKEGQAARLHVGPATVAGLFGEPVPETDPQTGMLQGAYGPMTDAWTRLVMTDDEYLAAAEFAYTVAAGSARRKNRTKLMEDLQQILPVMAAPALQMASAGVVGPWNGLMELMGDALEEQKRTQKFMLQPGEIPAMPGPGQEKPSA